jgi:hydrogenase maturation factor
MAETPLPLGKLPPEILASLISKFPPRDPRVVIGPRLGEDAAVIDIGEQFLVAKTDPITFATDEIGWYAVHINANDIATTGAVPAWFMATLLLPEKLTTADSAGSIFDQINDACTSINVTLVGGHTEITYGIDRPIVVGMMLGLVAKDQLITTGGAQVGDAIIVTKGVPVEAISIIAHQKRTELADRFETGFIEKCANYLHSPGISVLRDARIAIRNGRIHALHDPTEGGLATGLWEMAEASGRQINVDPTPAILDDGVSLCEIFGLDILSTIASGALLMSVHPDDAEGVVLGLESEHISAYQIGEVVEGPPVVMDSRTRLTQALARPPRDEIARLFE